MRARVFLRVRCPRRVSVSIHEAAGYSTAIEAQVQSTRPGKRNGVTTTTSWRCRGSPITDQHVRHATLGLSPIRTSYAMEYDAGYLVHTRQSWMLLGLICNVWGYPSCGSSAWAARIASIINRCSQLPWCRMKYGSLTRSCNELRGVFAKVSGDLVGGGKGGSFGNWAKCASNLLQRCQQR